MGTVRLGPSNSCLLLAAFLAVHGACAWRSGPAGGPRQPSTASPAALDLSPCTLPDLPRPARCGVLAVPENPEQPSGRRIPVSVAVVPARSGRALPDPIAVLMGGPGEDAISAAGFFADQLAPLLADRDLLLVDQRGTGRSGALRCDLSSGAAADSLRDFFPPAAVARCAGQLRVRADLTQYTYARFADDLEQVRRALGYGPLNLFAGSYGTRAAQVFVRAYPESVRTVYLGSVVPIDVATPLTFAQTMDGALESTFGACAAEPACRAAFPDLREEFRQILARLDSGVVRVAVPGGGTAPLHRGRVVEWLRSRLYRPATAAEVPWLIHRAFEGDWSAIAEGILSGARERDTALSLGLFFAVTCSEDVPFIGEAEVAPASAGTALGDYRLRQQQAACAHFPRAALPAGYRAPVRSSAPALFVSGDVDAGSPLWFTASAAPGFSERAEVVLRGRGHTEWSDCVSRLYQQLVRSGAARGLDPALCAPVPRPPFRTR